MLWRQDAVDWGYRQAYRFGFPLARLYWRLRQPTHQGTQVAIWVGGRVMFVRQSYRRGLTFPGGGVEAGEQPKEAAVRELREELSLAVDPDALRYVYQASGIWDGRRDTVLFYELHLASEPDVKLDHREILSASFLAPDALAGQAVSKPVAAYLRWQAGRQGA